MQRYPASQVLKAPIRYTSKLLQSFPCPLSVNTFAVSPDGKHVASGSRDGYVDVWDSITGAHIRDTQLAIRSKGYEDLDDGISIASLEVEGSYPIDALAYEPSGSRIICVCGNFIHELHAESLLPVGEQTKVRHSYIRCIEITDGCLRIAVGCEDGTISVWSGRVDSILWEKKGHAFSVNAIAFSPDQSRLATASDDGRVCMWDGLTGDCTWQPFEVEGQSPVCAVAFTSAGRSIAAGSWDDGVHFRDVETGEMLKALWNVKSPVVCLSFSDGDSRIISALASKQDSQSVFSNKPLPTSKFRCYFHGTSPHRTEAQLEQTLEPDGTREFIITRADPTDLPEWNPATGFADYVWAKESCIRVWDAHVLTRQQISPTEHTATVRSVAFSPNGKQITSASDDGTVRIWVTETGESLI